MFGGSSVDGRPLPPLHDAKETAAMAAASTVGNRVRKIASDCYGFVYIELEATISAAMTQWPLRKTK